MTIDELKKKIKKINNKIQEIYYQIENVYDGDSASNRLWQFDVNPETGEEDEDDGWVTKKERQSPDGRAYIRELFVALEAEKKLLAEEERLSEQKRKLEYCLWRRQEIAAGRRPR